MISRHDLTISGLNIETRNALYFVVFKAGSATKLYQRNLKALEKDTLTDIQDRLEEIKEEDIPAMLRKSQQKSSTMHLRKSND